MLRLFNDLETVNLGRSGVPKTLPRTLFRRLAAILPLTIFLSAIFYTIHQTDFLPALERTYSST